MADRRQDVGRDAPAPQEHLTPQAAALQDCIDDALVRSFSPPEAATFRHLAANAVATINTRPAGVSRGVERRMRQTARYRPLLVAASVLLTFSGLLLAWRAIGVGASPRNPYAVQPHRAMGSVYTDVVAGGWTPDWVCRDDTEFATAFRRQLGQALVLRGLPATITADGIGYSNTLTTATMFVLVSLGEARIMVFVDRLDAETTPIADDAMPAGLHLYRRVEGTLVLYELSPLEEPIVLAAFIDPSRENEHGN